MIVAYLCLVWCQAKFSLYRILLLQKRTIRILHSLLIHPLFHRYKVLKSVDLVLWENWVFVNKCFNNEAFSLFSNHFKLTASSHSFCTRSVSNGLIFKRLYSTFCYSDTSIISASGTWNHFQPIFHGNNLLNISPKN